MSKIFVPLKMYSFSRTVQIESHIHFHRSGSLVDLPLLYKHNQTTDRFNFISNVAFELELVVGLAIAAAALGVGASSGDGNCDDCCPSCCDSILNDLFR